jgi:hypothetical protein
MGDRAGVAAAYANLGVAYGLVGGDGNSDKARSLARGRGQHGL